MSEAVGGDGASVRTGDGSKGRVDDSGALRRRARRRALLRTLKVLATLAVVYFLILNIPGLRNAVNQLSEVKPGLLVLGLGLELVALYCYSVMTKIGRAHV